MGDRQISPERKQMYYVGMAITAVGVLAIVIGFISFVVLSMNSVHTMGQSTSPVVGFFTCFAGMVLAAIGAFIRNAAARGLAGSGILLDPEQARKDVEPWSRMAGGIAKDAIEETGLLEPFSPTPVFEDELRSLNKLRDEALISPEEYAQARAKILAKIGK